MDNGTGDAKTPANGESNSSSFEDIAKEIAAEQAAEGKPASEPKEPVPVETPPEPPKEEEPKEAPPKEEKKETPRFEKRIRQLTAKLAEANASQQAPAEPVAPASAPVKPETQLPDLRLPKPDENGEVSPDDLNAWMVKNAQALTSIEVQKLRAELAAKDQEKTVSGAIEKVQTTFASDLSSIESEYPQLNEDSDDFDPQLSQTVTESYEEALEANPQTASLKKIAKRIMAIEERNASKRKADVEAASKDKKSSGAVVSDAGSPKGKTEDEDLFLKGLTGTF